MVCQQLGVVDDDQVPQALLEAYATLFQLAPKDLEQVPRAHQRRPDHKLDALALGVGNDVRKGLEARVPALPRLVAVQVQDDKVLLRDVKVRPRQATRDGEVCVRVDAVLQHAARQTEALLDNALPPGLGECQGVVGVRIDVVDELAPLREVDLINVQHDLEPPVFDLPELGEDARDDQEVVVDDHHVRALERDDIHHLPDPEPRGSRVLVERRIVDVNAVREVCAVLLGLEVAVLEPEYRELHAVLVRFRELHGELVHDLGVPVELARVRAHQQDLRGPIRRLA